MLSGSRFNSMLDPDRDLGTLGKATHELSCAYIDQIKIVPRMKIEGFNISSHVGGMQLFNSVKAASTAFTTQCRGLATPRLLLMNEKEIGLAQQSSSTLGGWA